MERKNNSKLIKIGIIGPESSGKTWLSKQLAAHYNGVCVDEYARQYLSNLDRRYTCDDIENIARKQLDLENLVAEKATNMLFADTTLHVSKIWMNNFCNYCPVWIEDFLQTPHYDLILLMKPDLKWQPDTLREHPNLKDREYFFRLYRQELNLQTHTNYLVIKELGNKRLKNAIMAIENMVNW